ncbi:MAG: asparagine synthase (glutamine-hydrolyzing) [Planctomycetota bacterium]
MCGIAGFVGHSGVDPRDRLQRMSDRLTHRGPDDEGTFVDGASGLAFRRLSIVDLAGGNQPIADEAGRFFIVGNGEIYNAPELRVELEARGHRFRTGSDIETALHLFEEAGPACLSALNGMFALAILDRADQSVHIIRDRLGIKPLFYASTSRGVAFASELPALRAGLEPADAALEAPDPRALRDYLTLGYVPAPRTPHVGIHRLPAGHWARLLPNGDGVVPRAWWQLPAYAPQERPLDDWCDELAILLDDAIRLRARGDVEAGAFLSGGIDSATVLARLARHSRGSVPAFTIGFDEARFDEVADARRTAQHLHAEHHVEFMHEAPIEELDLLFANYGEPFADVSLLPTDRLARFAAQRVKFVLAGDGGDELFAGYAWLRREVRYRRLPSPLLAGARQLYPILGRGQRSTRSDWVGKTLRLLGDLSATPAESFLRRRSLCPPSRLDSLLHERVRTALGTPLPPTPLERHARDWHGSDFELLLDLDRRFYLGSDILEKVDRATMRHSLEARLPFLDYRIVEFAAGIPMSTHLGADGRGKAVLRRTAAAWLPAETFKRAKRGFGIPVDRWFRGSKLMADLEERLRDPSFREQELIADAAVERLIEEHRTGRARHGHLLWGLLSLAAWARGLDAAHPQPHARQVVVASR